MADYPAAAFGSLDADRFFGRIAERQRFRSLVRQLARGSGRSTVLAAPAGAGKTEFLKQCYNDLYREEEILPFYYAFPRLSWDMREFATDFFVRFAAQYLAFRRRDPTLVDRALAPDVLRSVLLTDGGPGGLLLAETARRLEIATPGRCPALDVSLLPHRVAEVAGMRVMCLLDEAVYLAGYVPSAQQGWADEALASRVAPMLLACRNISDLNALLGSDGAPGSVSAWRLGPLSDEASEHLVRHQARIAGLEIGDAAKISLVHHAGGSPFYLQTLVRALADRPAAGERDVLQTYVSEVCGGELARYWMARLSEALPDLAVRRTALDVLAFCLREETTAPEIGLLGGAMFKTRGEVEDAVAGLRRAGVVRVDCARLFIDDDPVFRDFIWALYRRELGRTDPGAVEAALVAEKVRGGRAAAHRREREVFRAVLRELLGAWKGQQVPAVLFKAEDYLQRYGGVSAEAVASGLEAETAMVALPEVVSVASGRIGQGSPIAALEVDALAWAFRAGILESEAAEVAWVARYMPGGEGSAAQIEDFERTVSALQAAGDLPAHRLMKWVVLGEKLDQPGFAAAARHRMSTSTLAQAQALATLLRVDVRVLSPDASPPPTPALEFEMTLPLVQDAELVAVRAVEQIAENLDLDSQEIGKIKMALVEALINAVEHSGARDGRVRLSFSLAGGDLRIRVENRGRALSPFAPESAARAGGRSKRGWGLTLIRELMDEVAFEPREDGVSLCMVKHLGGRPGDRG